MKGCGNSQKFTALFISMQVNKPLYFFQSCICPKRLYKNGNDNLICKTYGVVLYISIVSINM